ncbi:MAG: hypothetical protein DRP09_13290 [Candidatus Thorarchaeota archaeon]|nr:MAG: hypothetical protein DRP09_13290 [Candidatus Thorarchaeota archaeon]
MTDGTKNIPLKASIFTSGWNVPTSGDYQYQANYYGTTTGTLKLSTTAKPGCDSWENYMMVGYVNLATTPVSANNRIGYILRYQDSDNYFFVGFKTDTTNGNGHSTYEVYEKVSGSYSRITNQYDNGNNYVGSTETYYAMPDEVGSTGVLAANSQYHLRVDLYGNACRMYLQNVLIFENVTDFNTFSSGQVGLEAYTASGDTVIGYWDTIKVVS